MCTPARPPARITAGSSAGSSPGRAITTWPPWASGTHSSKSDTSNACGACISTRPRATVPHTRSVTSPASAPCGITTPLGVPVDPEVYIT